MGKRKAEEEVPIEEVVVEKKKKSSKRSTSSEPVEKKPKTEKKKPAPEKTSKYTSLSDLGDSSDEECPKSSTLPILPSLPTAPAIAPLPTLPTLPTPAPAASTEAKVFITNLPFHVDEGQLKYEFAQSCGKVLSFESLGNKGGMGVLTFAHTDSLPKAFEFHETEYAGRIIKVLPYEGEKKSNTRNDGTLRYASNSAKMMERPAGCLKVRVSNIGFRTSLESIKEQLEQAGDITDFYMPKKREDGVSNIGFAIVTFAKAASVDEAVGWDEQIEVDGRYLKIQYDLGKPSRN